MATRAALLKEKIRKQQETVIGAFCFLMNPAVVEFMGSTGMVDFIVVELEHTFSNPETAVDLARAAEVYGMTPFVRVPEADRITIGTLLDAGFKGIIVPQVRTAEDVRLAVASTKYAPNGTRGMANEVRGADFASWNDWTRDKVRQLDDDIIVGILPLENTEAIENLEEIMSVPGIDFASTSVGDITHALDHVGEWDHPDVRAVQDKLLRLCKDKRIPTFTSPINIGQAEYWYAKGTRMFTLVDGAVFEWGFMQYMGSIPGSRKKSFVAR